MPARFRGLGLRTVLWSVNAWDYDAGVSSEKIVGMVVRRVEPGDIVLLHDNARTAERGNSYLDGMISGIRDRGLPFGCLR